MLPDWPALRFEISKPFSPDAGKIENSAGLQIRKYSSSLDLKIKPSASANFKLKAKQ